MEHRSRGLAAWSAHGACWLLALLGGSCGDRGAESQLTQLELRVRSQDSWGLTQLELASETRRGVVPSMPTTLAEDEVITLILPDEQADTPLAIRVWGLAAQQRIAFGEVEVTPALRQVTRAHVTLERLACTGECARVPSVDFADEDAGAGMTEPPPPPPACEDCGECNAGVCESPPEPAECYATPGTCEDDSCSYLYANGVSCDDGDACTQDDSCAQGTCAGVPVRCDPPPATECLDAATLRTFAEGACAQDTGECAYASADTACEFGCREAACACEPGSWMITPVDDEIGDSNTTAAIFVEANGTVHVLYGAETGAELRHAAKPSGDAWGSPELVDAGSYNLADVALVVDDEGVVHALYDDPTVPSVQYAVRSSSGTFTATQLSPSARSPSLAIDTTGVLHASYYDNATGDLRYASKSGSGGWNLELADLGGAVGEFSAIAVDDDGGVHIAYYSITGNDLWYAYRRSGGAFMLGALATNGAVGTQSAVAVDASAGTHIAYFDPVQLDLVYAYAPDGGDFTQTPIDAEGDSGRQPAIAVDATFGVHFAYRHATRDLRYGHLPAGGPFTQVTVDAPGMGFLRPALAVDAQGGVHIAYYDDVLGLLKHAYLPVCAPDQ